MKKVLDLKFLVEEMIDISGRYNSGDFDNFYFERPYINCRNRDITETKLEDLNND